MAWGLNLDLAAGILSMLRGVHVPAIVQVIRRCQRAVSFEIWDDSRTETCASGDQLKQRTPAGADTFAGASEQHHDGLQDAARPLFLVSCLRCVGHLSVLHPNYL